MSPNQYLPLDLPASDDWTPRQFYRRLAHRLPPRLLQELRFLLNYPLHSTARAALVLCGPTELRHERALCPLDEIRERVTVAYPRPPRMAAEAGPCAHTR